ncbi:MAG: hypothetical protein CM15mP83_5330 [Flavobacteriaceae bacterium]|nr:MAG: hypothetical protein CM15mP83_5330 [Flavobacteriaceae bacterium]
MALFFIIYRLVWCVLAQQKSFMLQEVGVYPLEKWELATGVCPRFIDGGIISFGGYDGSVYQWVGQGVCIWPFLRALSKKILGSLFSIYR